MLAFLVSPRVRPMATGLVESLVDVETVIASSVDALVPHIAQIEGLIVSTPLYTRALTDYLAQHAPKLRWIQSLSTGVDHHLEAGIPLGVTLSSAAGAHARPVADHALALALALLRKLPVYLDLQGRACWENVTADKPLRTLENLNCLVAGYGPIGGNIVRALQAFDAKVVVANRAGAGGGPAQKFVALADLDSVLPDIDMVFLCLPEASETVGLLSRQRLERLKRGAFLVNVGRGSLVDEPALVDGLISGHIGGAGLDVTETEPLAVSSRLWTLPNVIITPHVAGQDPALFDSLARIIANNIQRFMAGMALLNVVEER